MVIDAHPIRGGALLLSLSTASSRGGTVVIATNVIVAAIAPYFSSGETE